MSEAAPPAVPPGFEIQELTGPLIVAYLLHWGLFGALTIQTYLYYEAFPNDRRNTKILVYGVYCLELVQTILVTFDSFRNFGYGFGNLKALTAMDFNWLNVPVMTAVVAFIGQSFYAYRIRILSRSLAMPILILAASITSSAAALATGAYSFIAGDIAKLNNHRTNVAVGVWCAGSAACDVLIALSMTYYLAKSDTGFRQTRVLISKLIRLTIETGTVTAVVALANMILFFVFPGKTYYATPAAVMPKIYANTILTVLNARMRIMDGRTTYVSVTDIGSNVMSLDFRRPGGQTGTTAGASSNTYAPSSRGVVISKEVLARYEGKVSESDV